MGVFRDTHGVAFSFPGTEEACFRFTHGDDVCDSMTRVVEMAWSAGFAAGSKLPPTSSVPVSPIRKSRKPRQCSPPPRTPPRTHPRPSPSKKDSPKRFISQRQLMRHKRHFNAAKDGLLYCTAGGVGVRVKSLHRFAYAKYRYEIQVRNRNSMETKRITGGVDPDGGQFNNDFYTTTAPRFKLENTAEPTWFKLCQTRGHVSDGLQCIHLSGNFTTAGARATELHTWVVERINARMST